MAPRTTPSLAWIAVLLTPGFALGSTPDPDDLAFFEAKIRPVLAEKCYRCHSAEADEAGKLKGGLLLDSREGMLLGGDSGPAVVPGEVEESVLIEAMRYETLLMPPEGKLADAVLADFEAWIARGAPDPRDDPAAPVSRAGIDLEAGREHWAYQPPVSVPAPEVADGSWPINDVDRFLLARVEAEGLRPVTEADRATLIRRLSFDLVGLPPTPEEVEAFVRDPSPDAFEELVDRLLASPRFGERWGRHWLDVARFAESITLRGMVFKQAWRYRDYVIDSFNDDVPFDRFVREQIAGDLLPAASLDDARRARVATGFLALGNNNLEEQDKDQLRMDVVDEQVETIGKALLAQTISCARCHDHKFDPIPTSDYYAIAGILRNARALIEDNVSNWVEVPMPMDPDREAAVSAHEAAVAALEARVEAARSRIGDAAAPLGVLAVADAPGIVVDDSDAARVGIWTTSTHSGTYIGAGYLHDADEGKGTKSLIFQPEIPEAGSYEVRLAYSHGPSRSDSAPVMILHADGETTLTVDLRPAPPIDGRFASLGRYRFEANGQGFVQLSNEETRGHVTADAVVFVPAGQVGRIDRLAGDGDDDGPAPDGREALQALEDELKRLQESAPPRDLAMSVVEEETIEDARIHIRGTVHNLGEVAPRGVLRVAMLGDPPAMPADQSGRVELADWIASPENPLTSRVIVNRAWHWLFGAGLVRTVDNFGTTGESPSHPELLDALAIRFVDEGWSLKALVRSIVTSRAYRLSTADDPDALAIDPENRLHWRMNRRRLDAESLRDAILAASGSLDPSMGGPTFPPALNADYTFEHTDLRRSVYSPVFRNSLPEFFVAFDFADPSMVVGRRDSSTVAPQALLLMNHPFVIDQALATARRLLFEEPSDDHARIDRAHRLVLGRPPADAELRIVLDFVADPDDAPEAAWALFVQALFGSIDFRYLR